MKPETLALLATPFFGFLGAWLVFRGKQADNKKDLTMSTLETLSKQVDLLTQQVGELRAENGILKDKLNRALALLEKHDIDTEAIK